MANFSDDVIQTVWEKGIIVPGYDAAKYRKDFCDAWIQRDKYGEQSTYGWEIDHVYPAAKGGEDEIDNLRPMNWANNNSKRDDYPGYTCSVTSDGDKNIAKEVSKTVNDDLQSKLKKLYNI